MSSKNNIKCFKKGKNIFVRYTRIFFFCNLQLVVALLMEMWYHNFGKNELKHILSGRMIKKER